MKNAEKLKNAMTLGRVYRRQELEQFSSTPDRDLKTLVKSGEVEKLAGDSTIVPSEMPSAPFRRRNESSFAPS
ncbi:MAG: hypothetical protein M0D55_06760 [Elusimicrobiota bacterium]|nr:MAG: hypothetical protein M0D55_06760 [Elusimicrobiota bacterium]